MNVASGELAATSLGLCTAAGIFVGLAWNKRRLWLWIGAAVLFGAGAFSFFCAAFTE
jgi:hypothetical protein